MAIDMLIENETLVSEKSAPLSKPYNANETPYSLFIEQYLEAPVISGDFQMALSPTACTIKNIPVIDDF